MVIVHCPADSKVFRLSAGNLSTFMAWVDKYRILGVLTNADTPEDAKVARDNGAEGIGLVRTEHMFFSSPERIAAVRRMIAAMELNAPGKCVPCSLQSLNKPGVAASVEQNQLETVSIMYNGHSHCTMALF